MCSIGGTAALPDPAALPCAGGRPIAAVPSVGGVGRAALPDPAAALPDPAAPEPSGTGTIEPVRSANTAVSMRSSAWKSAHVIRFQLVTPPENAAVLPVVTSERTTLSRQRS